jgi:hypothetical protein
MELGCVYANKPQWPKFAWVADACERLGHRVRRVDSRRDRDGLSAALAECDLCLFGHKGLGGRWPDMRSLLASPHCPIGYWWFDLVATQPGVPLVRQPLFTQFRQRFVAFDYSFVKERGLVEEYRENGVNAHWCDQGCPSDMPPAKVGDKWDLLVWGQCGPAYRERSRAAHGVAEAGFRVGWACERAPGGKIEHLPWTHPRDLPALASQARCVLSCGSRNDLDGYRSDRFWMALGMGCCVIRRSTPGLPEGPYQIYHTTDECVSAVRWAKENVKQARNMGREAREWVMIEHTIEKRVESILAVCTAGTPAGSL